jgi:hypothetical protein
MSCLLESLDERGATCEECCTPFVALHARFLYLMVESSGTIMGCKGRGARSQTVLDMRVDEAWSRKSIAVEAGPANLRHASAPWPA